MAAIVLHIHPENPEPRKIQQAVDVLRRGGVIIYPTDTVYAMGCDIFNHKAVDKLCRIKGVKAEKTKFSFICCDLSNISEYVKSLSTPVFKVMKKALPGPFTFILKSNNQVPKMVNAKKKTVGIRVPDNNIPRDIVRELARPIITTSIRDEDDIVEYATDPEMLIERYEGQVDLIINGGFGRNEPSTVVDCTQGYFEVIREGRGDLDLYL